MTAIPPTMPTSTSSKLPILIPPPAASGSITYGLSNIVGYNTAQMQQQSSYLNWDFSTIWGISPGINNGYPHLINHHELTALETPVPAISLNAADNSALITWNAVPSAASYRLYCSDDPAAEFPSGWTQLSVLSSQQALSYTDSIRNTGRFYRIIASTQ